MPDLRFPRNARLLSAADFRRVFALPERSADQYFTVLAVPGRQPQARLGLAIAKKQARRAVDRNRLKRLVREVFRHDRPRLAGLDLVVMVRRAAVTADNGTLRRSLQQQFERLAGKIPR